MNKSDLKIRKVIKYGLKEAEKSRKLLILDLRDVKPEDIRKMLRTIINNFLIEYKLINNLQIADNEITPWIKKYCNFKDPSHLEVLFVLLRLRLFAHFKMIDDETAKNMVSEIERQYDEHDPDI